jgi:hypothetical protein
MEEIVAHLILLADYLVSKQFTFYGVRLLASRPTWRTRVSLFVWLLPLDLSGIGDPTSSYATAGIALRVSGVLKPHHHDKGDTIGGVTVTTPHKIKTSLLISDFFLWRLPVIFF